MSALWISQVTVTDDVAYGKYAALVGPAIVAHGGRFIRRGARFVHLEGNGRLGNVIAKFDTLEAAESCYRSADYQVALEYARAASERDLMIVETSK